MADIKMKMGKSPKTTKHRGNLYITSEDIPESKEWNIGDKVTVLVEIEVVGLRKPDKWEINEEGMSKDSIKIQSDILNIKTK